MTTVVQLIVTLTVGGGTTNFNPTGTGEPRAHRLRVQTIPSKRTAELPDRNENFDQNNIRSDTDDWEVQTSSGGFTGTGYVVPNNEQTAMGIGTAAQLTYRTQFTTGHLLYLWTHHRERRRRQLCIYRDRWSPKL